MTDETEEDSLLRIIREKNTALRSARNAIEGLRCALRRKSLDAFDTAALELGLDALTKISKELP